MTTAELRAAVADLATARPALLRYEDLTLALLSEPSLASARGILQATKESLYATRMVLLEAAERVGALVGEKRPAGGWGHE